MSSKNYSQNVSLVQGFFNLFIFLLIVFLSFYLYKMSLQLETLTEVNKNLFKNNEQLQTRISELVETIKLIQKPILDKNTPAFTAINSYDQNLYRIKLALILVGLCLIGYSCWSFYGSLFSLKFGIFKIFTAAQAALLNLIPGITHERVLQTIAYEDALGNTIILKFSQEQILPFGRVYIKPNLSDITYSLEDFFSAHMELFDAYLSTSNITLQAISNSSQIISVPDVGDSAPAALSTAALLAQGLIGLY